MAYIGKTPVIGNFQKCDSISVVNGQAAYTLQVGGANVSPQSENHMLVSLNGILQAPVDSFTVSGSTITFASNLITGDVIDFVMILGNVLDLGVPSDNTVTTAKLADSSVSLAKLTATGTKDATTFLRGDNTFATVVSGLSMADQWRLTTSYTDPDTTFITTNLERNDTSGFGQLGTGMTESSGVFSFPSTGIYLITFTVVFNITSIDQDLFAYIYNTINNSSYTASAVMRSGGQDSARADTSTTSFIFDVTNTANCKVKFYTESVGAGTIVGNNTENYTHMTFLRLGDT
jgi:hypothetical protein